MAETFVRIMIKWLHIPQWVTWEMFMITLIILGTLLTLIMIMTGRGTHEKRSSTPAYDKVVAKAGQDYICRKCGGVIHDLQPNQRRSCPKCGTKISTMLAI